MAERHPPTEDSPDEQFDLDAEFPDLAQILSNEAVWHEPPSELEDQVVAAVLDEAAQDRFFTGQGSPTPIFEEPAKSRRPARWLQAVAAVALVAVGFAAAFVLVSNNGRDIDADVVLELAGSEIAPDANATVELEEASAGVRIVLNVSDLDPAPPGTYYQAWLRNESGGVTAGTFHMRGGDDEIELWSGVTIENYPLFSVTLQQEGEGAESSGVVVFKGEIGQ